MGCEGSIHWEVPTNEVTGHTARATYALHHALHTTQTTATEHTYPLKFFAIILYHM